MDRMTEDVDVILYLADKLGEERAMAERREDKTKAEILHLRQQMQAEHLDENGFRRTLAEHKATIDQLRAENARLLAFTATPTGDGTHEGIVTNWQKRVAYLEGRLDDLKGDYQVATGWNERLKEVVDQLTSALRLRPAEPAADGWHLHPITAYGVKHEAVNVHYSERLCPICSLIGTADTADTTPNPETTEGTETR